MSVNSETLIKFLLSRRSVRRFKQESIPIDLVKKILDVARYAPSAWNKQPWIFIVVTDSVVKNKLAKIHKWAYPLEEAPICIVVACNKNESPDSFHIDCANAAMYIILAAHAHGLGTVWIHTLRNVEDIQRILNLPSSYIPIAMIAMGYPAEIPYPRPRKELRDIAYLNSFGNPLP
ncbi:nitroreductase family protein [Ignisphaera sp. 4213-co]|uniref:Nitroreductase family protein n=1 Tax=Ignisphaera cupida TaxID=3050454 RepID=A0ABD4Z6N8_9CREN|nr:nitroreductase family protein [Ignisphaera sp. 4213-co]MDK6028986.1 nitroreductase family protein [Ignisphaera sp. 4213-co]